MQPEGGVGPAVQGTAEEGVDHGVRHSMNEELHWQPMASMDLDLDREQPPHLRISGAGRRPRALGYAAQAIRAEAT